MPCRVFSPQTLSTRNNRGREDESELHEDAMVEHEEACNAREIRCAEKRRTKSSQASLPGATCSRPALHAAACAQCFCLAGEGVRHGKATLKCDKPSEKPAKALIPGGRSRGGVGGCAGAAGHKQDQLFLVNRNTAARKKHDVPIEKM